MNIYYIYTKRELYSATGTAFNKTVATIIFHIMTKCIDSILV